MWQFSPHSVLFSPCSAMGQFADLFCLKLWDCKAGFCFWWAKKSTLGICSIRRPSNPTLLPAMYCLPLDQCWIFTSHNGNATLASMHSDCRSRTQAKADWHRYQSGSISATSHIIPIQIRMTQKWSEHQASSDLEAQELGMGWILGWLGKPPSKCLVKNILSASLLIVSLQTTKKLCTGDTDFFWRDVVIQLHYDLHRLVFLCCLSQTLGTGSSLSTEK